jgi:hypothetical protein
MTKGSSCSSSHGRIHAHHLGKFSASVVLGRRQPSVEDLRDDAFAGIFCKLLNDFKMLT